MIVSRRVVKPRDCTFGFSIATTRSEFREQFVDPNRDGFAIKVTKTITKMALREHYYEQEIIRPVKRMRVTANALGAAVQTGVTSSDFRDLLHSSTHKVVSLVAHWSDDQVEFADGKFSAAAVSEMIPDEFSGILDLCVCHPRKLIQKILARPNRCYLIKYTDSAATLQLWLWFYIALLKALDDNQFDYINAFNFVMSRFFGEPRQNESHDRKRAGCGA